MTRRITIDPITRLEGHGKIDILLDEAGAVEECFFQVPELRGFEKFAEGRPIEEMPRITTRICGVCPEAHLMASAKAGDDAYGVTIPTTAKKIRELQYAAFFLGDHTTHFYALGGPDFVMGPDAPPAERNILGVIRKVGLDLGKDVIRTRLECHEVSKILGGRTTHPVNALPGGVSKGVSPQEQKRLIEIGEHGVDFAKTTLKVFDDIVLDDPRYVELIGSDAYGLDIHNMGLVDDDNRVNFYDGTVRVVDTNNQEIVRYRPSEYTEHIVEHVEPWAFLKFPYLKAKGWKGLVEGFDSGIYRATPLARLNASEGMATPLAHENYERMFATLGAKPVQATLATHWARIIEMVYAAEHLLELARDPEILGEDFRVIPEGTPREGIGTVEAPRGTLTHHYVTDDRGIIERANLIVGTTNNHAAICMSIKRAAQSLITPGVEVTEGILNMIEMAFRAYDPCFSCATHSLPGTMPLRVDIYDADRTLVKTLERRGQ